MLLFYLEIPNKLIFFLLIRSGFRPTKIFLCLQRFILFIMNLRQEKLKNPGRMTKFKVIDIREINLF